MATIIKHPAVQDYFCELTLPEIRARPNGITDLYEANKLILLKDYRAPIDLGIFTQLSGNIDRVTDKQVKKRVKKLLATHFFKGADPEKDGQAAAFPSDDPVRQAVYDVLCGGDRDLFLRTSQAMRTAHEAALKLFETCFPSYDYYRLVPNVRLTTTLFENMHWDNHGIPEDFQQVRIFCNLDQRPRIWHTSHLFTDYARELYAEHGLERFAGGDPNALNDFICADILGGTKGACTDRLPRHVIAFEPGEVWFGESRMISHQIFYGERAMVYMFFVKPENMLAPERRFNAQVESLHAAERARVAA